MPFPISRIGDVTGSGDAITGPGAPTVLALGLPVSCLGDTVSGGACTGAVTLGSLTVLALGRPVTRSTSQVTGVNPASGVPVATSVAGPGAVNVLVS
ncbi:MAG: PaaR repeat-containing protein [Gemmataceae bacterium]